MIPGCTVVELRADRTPGEQAQGCYTRVMSELRSEDEHNYESALSHKVRRATQFAWRVARDARRNAREHTRQGLATERFVGAARFRDYDYD